MLAMRVPVVATLAATLLLIASVATAQQDPQPKRAPTVQDDPSVPATNPETRSRTAGGTEGFTGLHQMSGTVTQIDKTTGALAMQSDAGQQIRVHFPPTALQSVEQGDRITVQLALKPAPDGAAGTDGANERRTGTD
ncbi:MAG TPA: hypothetical protein VIS07_04370 [Candidatus Binatia bacterium]